MIKVEGYKAFKGKLIIRPMNDFIKPFELVGEFLYKPETDCWYDGRSSYPARICEAVEDLPVEITVKEEPIDDFGFSQEIKVAIKTWLDYKKEKGQTYKKTGLKTLLNKIKTAVIELGEQAVINGVENSISNNYSGLFFEKPKLQYKTVEKKGDDFFNWVAEAQDYLRNE